VNESRTTVRRDDRRRTVYHRDVERVAAANEEAFEAWNGVLFDRFVQFREIVTTGLGAHGEAALAAHPPQTGDRALDVGCGFGDTTRRLAEIVGEQGRATGVDVAPRFIEAAQAEAADASLENIDFMVADVEATEFDGRFDYAFSRFGTMFFANPVAAMRNVRKALIPGGRLCMVVWRRKLDNDWLHRAENVVKDYLEKPDESDEPRCGPGPFSMADADTTSEILLSAGFENVELRRCDIPITIGCDLDDAVEFVMALGPAGEVIRLAGADAERVRPVIAGALREALADLEDGDGVTAAASTWIVSATAPADLA
jgi:SAM-dependent methyltransferase